MAAAGAGYASSVPALTVEMVHAACGGEGEEAAAFSKKTAVREVLRNLHAAGGGGVDPSDSFERLLQSAYPIGTYTRVQECESPLIFSIARMFSSCQQRPTFRPQDNALQT